MSPRITMLRASLAGVLTASALAVPSLHAQWGGVTIDPVVLNGPPGHAKCMTGSAPYATFSQQEWGRAHGLAANVRDQWFSRALPNGLVVGDGACGPRHPAYGLLFTNSYAVQCFLPNEDAPCSLMTSATNPPHELRGTGGKFAGRLMAAKLNVAMDRLGVLGAATRWDLGDLQMVSRVAGPLRGLSVDALIRLSDDTLAGRYGLFAPHDMRRCRIDVNRDGRPDVSPDDLYDALRTVNRNFDDGRTDRGALAPPCGCALPCTGSCQVGHGGHGHGPGLNSGNGRVIVNPRPVIALPGPVCKPNRRCGLNSCNTCAPPAQVCPPTRGRGKCGTSLSRRPTAGVSISFGFQKGGAGFGVHAGKGY